MNKKILVTSLAGLFLATSLTGCGSNPSKEGEAGATVGGAGIGLIVANQVTDNPFVKMAVGAVGGLIGNAIYKDLNDEFLNDETVSLEKVVMNNGQEAVKLKMPVHFSTGKFDVQKEDADRLTKMTKVIIGKAKGVVVVGHTDSQGSYIFNQKLSEKRAGAVANFVKSKGFDGKIESIGKGEIEPIADNKTSSGRASNRRVEIFIIPND